MAIKNSADAYLIARCIGCEQERAIAPGEIPAGEHPCCSACGMPMLPTKAKVKRRIPATGERQP